EECRQRLEVGAGAGVAGVEPQGVAQQAQRQLYRATLEAGRAEQVEQSRIVRRERQPAQGAANGLTLVAALQRLLRRLAHGTRGVGVERRLPARNLQPEVEHGVAQRLPDLGAERE